MLSGITNYIFGGLFKSEAGAQLTTGTDDSTNSRLILEDDGDWMLVHTNACDDTLSLVPVTRSSMMENSWYMTPSTRTCAVSAVDFSPLDKILMDLGTAEDYGLPKKNKKAKSEAEESNRGGQTKTSKKDLVLKEPCGNNAKINQVIRHIQNEAQGQKMMQYQQAKLIHLKQLERQNKVQDYQSKPQRQRRKDHCQRPSGRSNDRKSY